MAITLFPRIILKTSGVTGAVPSTSDLLSGEIAINTYDGKLFIKKTQGITQTIEELGYTGSQGYTGSRGNTGYVGSQGTQGVIGYTGSQGTQGIQGVQGYTGSKGDIGYTGSFGYTGSLGDQGYTGSKGDIGYTGSLGALGYTGSKGDTGAFGGATFYYEFDTDTTDTDPTSGILKFNNADISLATLLYIDDEDIDATDIQQFLRTIDDSTSTVKGHFKISNSLNADDFAIFTISGLTEASGYFKVDCSYVSGSATAFSDTEHVVITFARTGDRGDTGYTGSIGGLGYTGSAGTNGTQGYTGSQGPIGYTGSKGDTGSQGALGYTGSQGDQGIQGVTGYTGSQGAGGSAGATGYTGSQGDQGVQGVIGYTGSKGDVGNQGPLGYTGSQGATGYTGSKGDQGIQGDLGYTGSAGSAGGLGYTGSKGDAGSAGAIGYTGSAGGLGYTGSAGSQGAIGYTGSKGDIGYTGSVGVATVSIPYIIDGGGAVIATGVKGEISVPFNCTINAVTLLADQNGSIVIDIWKDTYANYPPTAADTITASAKPTISATNKSTDATLTGWTTSITAGNILRFNVDSVSTITRCTISLQVTKT